MAKSYKKPNIYSKSEIIEEILCVTQWRKAQFTLA